MLTDSLLGMNPLSSGPGSLPGQHHHAQPGAEPQGGSRNSPEQPWGLCQSHPRIKIWISAVVFPSSLAWAHLPRAGRLVPLSFTLMPVIREPVPMPLKLPSSPAGSPNPLGMLLSGVSSEALGLCRCWQDAVPPGPVSWGLSAPQNNSGGPKLRRGRGCCGVCPDSVGLAWLSTPCPGSGHL